MPKKFDRTGWISDKNKGQIEWLVKYLTDRGINLVSFTKEGSMESRIIQTINTLENNEVNKQYIQKTKAAWRSHKNRYQRKEKDEIQKSYILPTKAIARLKRLSTKSNTTINATLASVINNEYSDLLLLKQQEKKERLKAKQDKKVEKEYTIAEKLLFASPIKKLKAETIKLKNEVYQLNNQKNELNIKYEALLKLMSEFTIKLDDNGLLGIPLTEQQNIEAKECFDDLLKAHGGI